MKWENLHIAGLGTCLPDPVPVEEAVDAGRYDAERCKARGYVSVCAFDDADDSPQTAPPETAARAARVAVAQSGLGERDFALALHASIWFQGLDIYPTASYVAQGALGRQVPAYDVQQRCNGALGAIELAGAQLATGIRPGTAALITTGDRFAAPGVDRWNLAEYNVYADGGTAMVLATGGGFARILSTVTVADNALEGITRGAEPFRPAPGAAIDLTARSAAYDTTADGKQADLRTGRLIARARHQALADAGVAAGDLARIVTGSTGLFENGWHWHHLLGVDEHLTTWEYGRTTGHIGAGDWAAGLDWLLRTHALETGDKVLLFGGGAGYSLTAAVVEITALPY
ncbi:secondary metabolite biosynthesis protein [Streptomyces sp. SID8379]|uniref:ketoacyl-ACP synthase III family protein n=1 Tax=unclassified Streptomyces TaxID=2593676 RepID=UPI00036DCF17|nr:MULTISPECIES: ketoacyl-ACP synthase III family protein [unclassified Streptomyces]MYW65830.1 secondary metabolite biosynthesis protein [Streptomyces sp. SID8379]